MPRPLIATIDIAAMQSNLALARRHAGDAKTWAVVKANAYGHGLVNAVRGFAAADGMALVEIESAVELRGLGWDRPILLLEGAFDGIDLSTAAAHSIAVVVHCEEQIRMLEQIALARPLEVHLKINTGMNRLGFRPDRFAEALKRLRLNANVSKVRFLTHLANADAPKQLSQDTSAAFLRVEQQASIFRKIVESETDEFSIANSAASLLHPALAADWIRPGIMLYGGSPGLGTAKDYGLEPAMTLASRIIGVQQIAAGEAVGYGSRYIAPHAMRIGIVACGYADGYPRSAPDGTPILVDRVRTAVVGRVSMDMITVDLTPVPDAGVDSEVILWGRGLPIDEVAAAAGTIGYELMCALTVRVAVTATPAGMADHG